MTVTLETRAAALSPEAVASYHGRGYVLVPQLLPAGEVAEIAARCDTLHARGAVAGCFSAVPVEEARAQGDILKAYPRMMHPHRADETLKAYMLHPAFAVVLRQLLGEEAIAAQSMFYWKPPSARGQAFHQDNFYLKVRPGTCIAAWVAVDATDEENGCLFVAPGSHTLDIVCPEEADASVSFTKDFVPVPDGLAQVAVPMEAGDVLFFGGNLIHGSFPNRSKDRFRRSFICHYAGVSAHELSRYYAPLYDMRGDQVRREVSQWGGPCGVEATGPH